MIALYPFGHIQEPYIEKKLAFIFIEKSLIYQQHPTAEANALNEQFQPVYTDEDMVNLPSCKKLFPYMTKINFDIYGVIKQTKNYNKANC